MEELPLKPELDITPMIMADEKQGVDEKYNKFLQECYADLIELDKLKTRKNLPKWMYKAIDDFHYLYSSLMRHEIMADIRHIIPLKKTEYICTVFRATRARPKGASASSIYTILLSYEVPRGIIAEYVILGPTYKSADGEYRYAFVPNAQLSNYVNLHKDTFERLEKCLSKQLKSGELTLTSHTYYPAGTSPNKDYEALLQRERYVTHCFIASALMQYPGLEDNMFENHMHEDYIYIMFGDGVAGNSKCSWIDDSLTSDVLWPIRLLAFGDRNDPTADAEFITVVGQKLIPLTTRAVESIDDIRVPVWKEIFVGSLISDLVLNGICGHVPQMNDWFFLQASDAGLFDNASMHSKFDHSEVAADIVRKLEAARRHTFVLDPVKKNEIFISYKMNNLSQAIEVPMDYAENELVLSPYTLGVVMEHTGRTVGDLPRLMLDPAYAHNVGPIFKEEAVFAKYLFEFLYALWCFNSRLGIIHGDLHLNNCTIFNIHRGIADIGIYMVLYTVGGRDYTFRHYGRTISIIDYSRSYIWKKDILQAHGYSHEQIDALQEQHRRRIIDHLVETFPDYTTPRRADIEQALHKHFDLVYRIFQVVDAHRLALGWKHTLQTEILKNSNRMSAYGDALVIENKLIPLVDSLRDAAYDFYTTHMDELISSSGTSAPEIPEPNLLFIRKFFSQYELSNTQPPGEPRLVRLMDYWRDDREMKYTGRSYDKLPPGVSLEYPLANDIASDRVIYHSWYQRYLSRNPEAKLRELIEKYRSDRSTRRFTK